MTGNIIRNYESAIRMFESISGWKRCRRADLRLPKEDRRTQGKEEAERLEAERKAEAERLERERKEEEHRIAVEKKGKRKLKSFRYRNTYRLRLRCFFDCADNGYYSEQ